jgi:hypothetical protein
VEDAWLFGDAAKPLAAIADDCGSGRDAHFTRSARRLVSRTAVESNQVFEENKDVPIGNTEALVPFYLH